MTVTTCNTPDAVPSDRKIPIRAIHAFSRFLFLNIYHIHIDVYDRNIGTKRTESQSPAGFEGVPEICSGFVPQKQGTPTALFRTSGKILGTSPAQSPERCGKRWMRCRCGACIFFVAEIFAYRLSKRALLSFVRWNEKRNVSFPSGGYQTALFCPMDGEDKENSRKI